MKTNVYVDGYNLYYNALKGTPYKWLNIRKLCELAFPEDEILYIKYYTATPIPTPDDESVHTRHGVYMRALQTLENLQIIKGNYQRKEVNMPLVKPPHKRVRVFKTEEKGSDVNLAVHLLNDAYLNHYELAIVISDDSDLVEAVRLAKKQNKSIGHYSPSKKQGYKIQRYCTFSKRIDSELLKKAQFPDQITDKDGRVIRKPESW